MQVSQLAIEHPNQAKPMLAARQSKSPFRTTDIDKIYQCSEHTFMFQKDLEVRDLKVLMNTKVTVTVTVTVTQ